MRNLKTISICLLLIFNCVNEQNIPVLFIDKQISAKVIHGHCSVTNLSTSSPICRIKDGIKFRDRMHKFSKRTKLLCLLRMFNNRYYRVLNYDNYSEVIEFPTKMVLNDLAGDSIEISFVEDDKIILLDLKKGKPIEIFFGDSIIYTFESEDSLKNIKNGNDKLTIIHNKLTAKFHYAHLLNKKSNKYIK